MLLVATFGASLLAIGLMDRAGLKVNEGFMKFTLEMLKFGVIVYLLKMVSDLFLMF